MIHVHKTSGKTGHDIDSLVVECRRSWVQFPVKNRIIPKTLNNGTR